MDGQNAPRGARLPAGTCRWPRGICYHTCEFCTLPVQQARDGRWCQAGLDTSKGDNQTACPDITQIQKVAATDGCATDSPEMARLCAKAPYWTRYACWGIPYCSKENCKIYARVGRMPCLRSRKNYTAQGTGACDKMMAQAKDHPCTFYKIYNRTVSVRSRTALVPKLDPQR